MAGDTRFRSTLLAGLLALAGAAVRADPVVVAAAASPLETLGPDDVARIFLGKTETTPAGHHVVPVDQPEGVPVREQFYRQLTGKTAAQLRAYRARLIFTGQGQPPRQLSLEALARFLAANPSAIGYCDRGAVPAGLRILYAPVPEPSGRPTG